MLCHLQSCQVRGKWYFASILQWSKGARRDEVRSGILLNNSPLDCLHVLQTGPPSSPRTQIDPSYYLFTNILIFLDKLKFWPKGRIKIKVIPYPNGSYLPSAIAIRPLLTPRLLERSCVLCIASESQLLVFILSSCPVQDNIPYFRPPSLHPFLHLYLEMQRKGSMVISKLFLPFCSCALHSFSDIGIFDSFLLPWLLIHCVEFSCWFTCGQHIFLKHIFLNFSYS